MSKYTIGHKVQEDHTWLWYVKKDGKIIATILSDRSVAFAICERLEDLERANRKECGAERARVMKNYPPTPRIKNSSFKEDSRKSLAMA